MFTDGKQHKASEHDHAPRSYVTSLSVTLSVLDMILPYYNLQLGDVIDADFENSLYAFGQSGKR